MSNGITIKDKQSPAENLNEFVWVLSQTKNELNTLTENVGNNFYENKEGKVIYNIDLVKTYLNKLNEDMKDMDSKKAWKYLKSKKRTAAWIMAVQIALESLDYDVGKIDGILRSNSQKKAWVDSNTMKAVKKFQGDNGLTGDGLPGKDTISKLIEKLWVEGGEGNSQGSVEEGGEGEKSIKIEDIHYNGEIEIPTGDIEAKDLVQCPGWVTVWYKDWKGVDKSKDKDNQKQNVTLEVYNGEEKIGELKLTVIINFGANKITVMDEKANEDANNTNMMLLEQNIQSEKSLIKEEYDKLNDEDKKKFLEWKKSIPKEWYEYKVEEMKLIREKTDESGNVKKEVFKDGEYKEQ